MDKLFFFQSLDIWPGTITLPLKYGGVYFPSGLFIFSNLIKKMLMIKKDNNIK
mgnify:CR=1 FL=1